MNGKDYSKASGKWTSEMKQVKGKKDRKVNSIFCQSITVQLY